MTKKFVRVVCNIACKWEGLPPIYRLYIDDELFTERTWTWPDDHYLREEIQIDAEPGEYNIRYELVPPNLAELLVTRPVVDYGIAVITDDGKLRIPDEIA
jgi:hypothetical protein